MRRDFEPVTRATGYTYDQGLRKYMSSVFGQMALGLMLTALVAYGVSISPEIRHFLFGNALMQLLVTFAPLGIVVYFSMRLHKLSYEAAQGLFYVYAFLVGLSLSTIFMIYMHADIARTFLITSAMFGSMSFFGYTTNIDLTKFGSFLIMGVIGLFISMIINLFVQSTGLQLALSFVGVLIFVGLTAYDVQFIKNIYNEMDGEENTKKLAVYGALKLYLDFINIFIFLLQLTANQSRK